MLDLLFFAVLDKNKQTSKHAAWSGTEQNKHVHIENKILAKKEKK